mmetsp:Transcript_46632/g.113379  ORF Transcript_46632/g.113379 Transcript_46632/m.113379 type:complete len:271 (-) Transcript_46632:134-946(-)
MWCKNPSSNARGSHRELRPSNTAATTPQSTLHTPIRQYGITGNEDTQRSNLGPHKRTLGCAKKPPIGQELPPTRLVGLLGTVCAACRLCRLLPPGSALAASERGDGDSVVAQDLGAIAKYVPCALHQALVLGRRLLCSRQGFLGILVCHCVVDESVQLRSRERTVVGRRASLPPREELQVHSVAAELLLGLSEGIVRLPQLAVGGKSRCPCCLYDLVQCLVAEGVVGVCLLLHLPKHILCGILVIRPTAAPQSLRRCREARQLRQIELSA